MEITPANHPEETSQAHKARKPRQRPKPRKRHILSVVGAVVVLGLSYFAWESYFYVSSDNANIEARSTLLSARVSGTIVKADVDENQKVKKDQVLVEIQPDDFQAALDQAQGELAALQETLKGAEIDYNRALHLYKKGASTREKLDSTQIRYLSLQQQLKAAQAKVQKAQLNLSYTQVRAPADGQVGRKSFEVGMFAARGQPLLGFVAGGERWVVANLKETSMTHVRLDEKVYVDVDADPDREFEGVVESISPATGATFSLLPPDNATGNFTKVVQRVPVRIKLLNLTAQDVDRLQNGLSAEVKIKIR